MPRRLKTIHALHPNLGVERWYRDEIDALLREAQVELVAALAPVWPTDPLTEPARLATDAGVDSIRKRLQAWGRRWSSKFNALAPKVAAMFASKSFAATETAFKAALRDAGFTVRFKPTRASMNAYKAVLADNVGLIKSIPEQYLSGVQTLVWQSVKRGGDMGTLSVKLREKYGVTVKRAALIARDQNSKAKAVIEQTRRLEIGITHAIWQHSHAGKEPRPSHVAMNNKVFDLAKGMWDPDEGEFVLPGQLINCRCSSRAVLPGLNE